MYDKIRGVRGSGVVSAPIIPKVCGLNPSWGIIRILTSQHSVFLQLLSCLQMFAGMSSVLILCALTFIPVLPHTRQQDSAKTSRSKLVEVAEKLVYLDNWRNKRFVVWTLAVPLALFGYFVPYCHLVSSSFIMSSVYDMIDTFQPQFAKDIPLDSDDIINGEKASKLIMCIGVSSGM